MPGRRKIGGCSIAPNAQRSASDAASPRAIKSHGNTVNPATSATGCAQPVVRRSAQAAVHAANRSPAPTSQALAGAPAAAVAADARAVSHRKFPTASAPPASTPTPADAPPSQATSAASAATAAQVSSVTRVVSSFGVIELSLRTLHRSKEVHESRGDPESEPDQQEPGLRSQPTVSVVAADEPDDRRDDQRQPDRGQLPERFPGPLLPGRHHVKKDTSTLTPSGQAIVTGCFHSRECTPPQVGATQPSRTCRPCGRPRCS